MSHSVAHTNPALPSQSIIKTICYPQLFKVDNKAVHHGSKNESKAISAYSNVMSVSHKHFNVSKCGMFIDKEKPWMNATPDLIHVQDSHTCEMTVSHMHQIIQSNLTIHALLVPYIYMT